MFAKSTAVNRLGSATSHRRLEKMSGKSQEKSWEKVKKKVGKKSRKKCEYGKNFKEDLKLEV